MDLVYICSPLRGDIERNIKKAIGYSKFAASMGVVPLAPHTIFTQYLDDTIPEEREQGLRMGIELLKKCNQIWVFGDVISEGMQAEINLAIELGISVVHYPSSLDLFNFLNEEEYEEEYEM